MSSMNIDADQRITQDLEKLTGDLSGLVTGMVKPTVDILWFTWRVKLLTGRRGFAILYAYMLLGLGFLRSVAPDFGDLASREQQLKGTFRFMHERLRTHAESIAFFGGGAREKAIKALLGDYDAIHVRQGDKLKTRKDSFGIDKALHPHLDRDTRPEFILCRISKWVPPGRTLFIASNERTPGFFSPLGISWKVLLGILISLSMLRPHVLLD